MLLATIFVFIFNVMAANCQPDTCETPLNITGKTTQQILYALTEPCRYDRWSRPNKDPAGGEPTNVAVRIYIYFLGSVEPQHLHFTVHVLIRYRWKDERLARNDSKQIQGESVIRDRLWTPHLYIVNEHESSIMGSNQQDILVTITPDGTVFYSTRLKVTLLCLMNLQKFPFDRQECPLVLESWRYNSSNLLLSWEENSPVVINSHLRMAEYNLAEMWTNSSFVVYSLPMGQVSPHSQHLHHFGKFAGNYSSLTVFFQLEREVGHYIMDYYVPSILLVVVSWVTFWLDPNAVPGRTTLGTSTMLTFITLSRNTGSSLPKVSYIKATEIWFIGCTIFIFGSLVEFAFVNTIWRRRKNVQLKKVNSKHVLKATLTPQLHKKGPLSEYSSTHSLPTMHKIHQNNINSVNKSLTMLDVPSSDTISSRPTADYDDDESSLSCHNRGLSHKGLFTMTPQQIAQWIDHRSRTYFPIAFFIFNVFYWIFVYM